MKDIYAKEILSLYLIKKEESQDDIGCDVAVKQKNAFDFDPFLVAGLLTSIFDFCIDLAPESIQNDFEKVTLKLFKEMLKNRYGHITKLDNEYRKE